MKRLLAILLMIILVLSCSLSAFAGQAAMTYFVESNEFSDDLFTDLDENAWYMDNVKKAYELGLMLGSSATEFNPDGNIQLSEAVTMAARIHSIYNNGKDEFVQGDPWYQVYVDYAVENGIIDEYSYVDYTAFATRRDFALILAKSLPSTELAAINTIADGMIPGAEGNEIIYMLYNAGILTGSDEKGSFEPETNIGRSSVAAIVTRMADKTLRVRFNLERASLRELVKRDFVFRAMITVNCKVKALITSQSGKTSYIFSAPEPDDFEEKREALDFFEDDYIEKLCDLILSLDGASIEDISNRKPSQDELNKYVGKTLADLETAGFEEWGSFIMDDWAEFEFYGDEYEYQVDVDPYTGSENDHSTYVITGITFTGFSSYVLDEPFDFEAVLEKVKTEKNVKAFEDSYFSSAAKLPDDGETEFTVYFSKSDRDVEKIYKVVLEFGEEEYAKYLAEDEIAYDSLTVKEITEVNEIVW